MKDSKAIEIALLLLIGAQLSRLVSQLGRKRTELAQTVDRFDDRLLSLRKMLQALRDETEAEAAGEPEAVADLGQEYWETVRSLWATTRNRIELEIDLISDGRVRRKYANMDRYSYSAIIFALNADKFLDNAVAAHLIQMSGTFMKLRRNPKSTTKQDADRFESLYRAVSSSLPVEGPPEPEPQSATEKRTKPSEWPMPELALEIPGVTARSANQSQATNGSSMH
jgi:hypothetical protein